MSDTPPWICCQRGARENYTVPRALARRGCLDALLTDFWWPYPWGLSVPGLAKMAARSHAELMGERVVHFNGGFLVSEISRRFSKRDWFHQEQAQNRWFQKNCVQSMKALAADGRKRTVFAFSYAARDILRFAKDQGWQTVLGQIDPGPRESEIVLEEYQRLNLAPSYLYQSPSDYWDDWREETLLADRIMVNSSWSAKCLEQTGIDAKKTDVVPCAFEPDSRIEKPQRQLPVSFTKERPLHVLFLGQTIIRKGIHVLMEAAGLMRGDAVKFTIAGGGLDLPDLKVPENVDWLGPVLRADTTQLYTAADVFILPTLSDGFAITQLEALARGLPVIVSRHCGDVITQGVDGALLDEVSAAAIVKLLRSLLSTPDILKKWTSQAHLPEKFSVGDLGLHLLNIVPS